MRIGLVAPPWIPIPPPAYGGIERVVAVQAAGLAAAGHDVTLCAAPGSAIEGVRVIEPLDDLPVQIGMATDEWRHVLGALDALADVDVLVDHSGPLGALLSAQSPVPSMHVVHGSLEGELLGIYDGLVGRAPRLRLAAISRSQRLAAPHLPFAGVCHNAIDVDTVPFGATPESYLAFLGRMAPEKGAAEAIVLAREAGRPLLIAAKCREPAERAYFDREVAPHLGPDVVFLGELGRAATYEFLSRAAALLFPISWREPFGMVLVEAMACGTPVLATDRGAVREIVRDGVTGFVRNTAAELGPLIDRLDEIDRAACRRHVAAHFSGAALVRGYEPMLAAILDSPRDRLSPAAVAPMVFRSPVSPSRPVRRHQGVLTGRTPAQAPR
ncbi:MAG: glycosyl transferase family 1 [Pseudonocardia sp.]|nr:glycosyl transferase family 1 [Pseudonocardia sp.]